MSPTGISPTDMRIMIEGLNWNEILRDSSIPTQRKRGAPDRSDLRSMAAIPRPYNAEQASKPTMQEPTRPGSWGARSISRLTASARLIYM